MQITDLIRQYNKATDSNQNVNSKKGVEKLTSSLQELSTGNVFEGTVKYAKNGQVVLGLSNGQRIVARMDGKVPLEEGQSMFFQVKSNDGTQIAIRPYTLDGNSINLTLLQALKAANLPVDGDHLSMVNQMMQEQMSIDRNSLSQMARVLTANPGVKPQTLVQMQKLNLPISPEMAAQFEKYMNNNQAIHESMNQFLDVLPTAMTEESLSAEGLQQLNLSLLEIVTEGLPEAGQLNNMADQGGSQNVFGGISQGVQVIIDFDGSITLSGGAPEGAVGQEAGLVEGEIVPGQEAQGAGVSGNGESLGAAGAEAGATGVEGTTGAEAGIAGTDGAIGQEAGVAGAESAAGQETANGAVLEEGAQASKNEGFFASGKAILADLFSGVGESQGTAETLLKGNDAMDRVPHTLGALLTDKGMENLERSLSLLSGKQVRISQNTTTADLLNFVKQTLEMGQFSNKDSLRSFFGGKEFSAVIKDALQQQWTITPKELESEAAINKLYEKMEQKVTQLELALHNAGVENANISQAAADVRGNVEFMNQVNQLYTYVQIPLKMSGQTASGELYVYTNKKNIQEGKEELTAFLHLDMDNLGSTDVSIRLKGKELSTNFYLDDDASFDLVQEHLPILEARLAAKGYNSKISVSNESKKVDFVDDFLKKDQPSAGQVHRYSFDMRA